MNDLMAGMVRPFGGVNVIVDSNAAEHVADNIVWPRPSRHRSRRVLRKLLRRSVTKLMEPRAYQLRNGTMIVHPAIAAQLRARTRLLP